LETLVQGSATYGTRATLGTPSNFQWHAEAPRLHTNFVMIHNKYCRPWLVQKDGWSWHTEWFGTL